MKTMHGHKTAIHKTATGKSSANSDSVMLNSDLATLALVIKDRTASLTGSHGEEFQGLVDSASLKKVTTHSINLRLVHQRHLIGRGQLDELAALVKQHDIEQLVLNLDIDARHQNTIAKYLEIPVYDRTAIILDVFARRARTYEGKIQVEMAQVEYSASRLVRGWTHLERQRSGIGVRGGPGEKQLEIDRRLLRDKMKRLKKKFEKVKKQRNLSRSARRKAGFTTISLVGYTNAGKSTLFNLLTSSAAQSSDALFTTLDPTIRKVSRQPAEGVKPSSFLIADTVGFIESLSAELMQSFAATFGEIHDSDLLLHVVDINDKATERKQEAVESLLEDLDAGEIPVIMVYNKIDKQEDTNLPDITYDENGQPTAVWVSAANKINLDILTKSIDFFVKKLDTNLITEDYTDDAPTPDDYGGGEPKGYVGDEAEDYEVDTDEGYNKDGDEDYPEQPAVASPSTEKVMNLHHKT